VCPRGRPIVKRLALIDLLREFGRIWSVSAGQHFSFLLSWIVSLQVDALAKSTFRESAP
jgi:hypothetical protein